MNKKYLGDSVYVELDGDYLILTTANGIKASNRIILEPPVILSLMEYIDEMILC